MKNLFILTALLLCASLLKAQTSFIVSLDAEKLLNAKTKQNYAFALKVGIGNWQADQIAVGVVAKQYNNETIYGARLGAWVRLFGNPLGGHAIAYTENDAFFKEGQYFKYTDQNGKERLAEVSARLEVSAGIGYVYKGAIFTAGIRADDYDPSIDYMVQPAVVTHIAYTIRFKKLN